MWRDLGLSIRIVIPSMILFALIIPGGYKMECDLGHQIWVNTWLFISHLI